MEKEQTFDTQRIKLLALGGTGGTILKRIHKQVGYSIESLVLDSDKRQLMKLDLPHSMHLGESQGLVCGTDLNLELGSEITIEAKEKLLAGVEGVDMVILIAGLGGGLGSAAVSEIVSWLNDTDIKTMAMVSTPFAWEAKLSVANATTALDKLKASGVPLMNYSLQERFPKDILNSNLDDLYEIANLEMAQSVLGLIDLIYMPGVINLDLLDIKVSLAINDEFVHAYGEIAFDDATIETEGSVEKQSKRLIKELKKHFKHFNLNLKQSPRLLINLTSSSTMGLRLINIFVTAINNETTEGEAEIILGTVLREEMEDRIGV
ncbi:MAG: hypothetical protein GW809_04710, partial [Bacteroidetes bacterium]|nr:hypothetical protein [Bacteroidota bacterium]